MQRDIYALDELDESVKKIVKKISQEGEKENLTLPFVNLRNLVEINKILNGLNEKQLDEAYEKISAERKTLNPEQNAEIDATIREVLEEISDKQRGLSINSYETLNP